MEKFGIENIPNLEELDDRFTERLIPFSDLKQLPPKALNDIFSEEVDESDRLVVAEYAICCIGDRCDISDLLAYVIDNPDALLFRERVTLSCADDMPCTNILNFAYRRMLEGDTESRSLLKMQCKKHLKKEFNVVKRLSTLSPISGIFEPIMQEKTTYNEIVEAIINLFIADVLGIDTSRCAATYAALAKTQEHYLESQTKKRIEQREPSYREIVSSARKIEYDEEKLSNAIDKYLNAILHALRYAKAPLFLFPETEEMSLPDLSNKKIRTAIAIMDATLPSRKESDMEAYIIILLAFFMQMIQIFSRHNEEQYVGLKLLKVIATEQRHYIDWIEEEEEKEDDEDTDEQENVSDEKNEVTKQASDKAELELLRERLKKSEEKAKSLSQMYEQERKRAEELAAQVKEHEKNKEELIALRKLAYNLAEEDVALKEIPTEEMAAAIGKKKILIIGGHDNWTYKLRNKFKNWEFVKPRATGTADIGVLNSADMVYFFTDMISHSVYNKFCDRLRETGKPFGYIHSVNIEKNIDQIYKDLYGEGDNQ